jgi:hypothetical protein
MRRLAPLLFLLIANARADTLPFGPERELVPARWMPASGRIDFAGAATDGERVAVAWAKLDWDSERWFSNYVSFPGRRPIALPINEQGTGVVWSGKSFFFITRSEEGGHLIPLSSDGTPGAPRGLGLKMGVIQSASNGDGFLVASAERSVSLHARLFDREGKLLHDVGQIDEPLSTIRKSGSDYVIGRLVIHPDGAHELRPETPLDTFNVITPSDSPHVAPVRDGSTYLVFARSGVRRYSAKGALLESMPGDYEWPQAIVPRKKKPPLLVWLTKEMALRTNDDTLVLERIVDEAYPRASSDGASTIVAWRDGNGLAATVFGSPDEPRRVVELPGSPRTPRFAAVSLRGVHCIVWRDSNAVRMMRVSATGTLLDAAPVTIAQAAEPWRMEGSNGPALATNGRGVLTAWTDGDVVRAASISPDGTIGTPFAVASSNDNYGPFSLAAAADGLDFVVYWIEASRWEVSDHLPLPFAIRSAAVHDNVAQPATTVVPAALYPQRLSILPGRALWAEYRIWFSGAFAPEQREREPSFIVLYTVARPVAGKPVEIARMPRMTWNNPPAADVTALPLDGGAVALWSETGALMALPLDENYQRAGEPRQIGEAVNEMLSIARTNAGTLLVYARRDGGSSRLFTRWAARPRPRQ